MNSLIFKYLDAVVTAFCHRKFWWKYLYVEGTFDLLSSSGALCHIQEEMRAGLSFIAQYYENGLMIR